MDIVWYPGHMAAAKRQLQKEAALADAVIELLDARIPLSSRNPDIETIFPSKPRLILLTKCSLADAKKTSYFVSKLTESGKTVIPIDCKTGKNISKIPEAIRELLAEKTARYEAKGMTGRKLRAMVVGITNVGKSTFINAFSGTDKAKAEDRPGVTRRTQWINAPGGIELLDTPGLLWHKFEDKAVGVKLALTGAIRDEILDLRELSYELLRYLTEGYKSALEARYKLEVGDSDPTELFERIGRKRGFLMAGGIIDEERTAVCLLDEFRGGKIGNITLD